MTRSPYHAATIPHTILTGGPPGQSQHCVIIEKPVVDQMHHHQLQGHQPHQPPQTFRIISSNGLPGNCNQMMLIGPSGANLGTAANILTLVPANPTQTTLPFIHSAKKRTTRGAQSKLIAVTNASGTTSTIVRRARTVHPTRISPTRNHREILPKPQTHPLAPMIIADGQQVQYIIQSQPQEHHHHHHHHHLPSAVQHHVGGVIPQQLIYTTDIKQ